MGVSMDKILHHLIALNRTPADPSLTLGLRCGAKKQGGRKDTILHHASCPNIERGVSEGSDKLKARQWRRLEVVQDFVRRPSQTDRFC